MIEALIGAGLIVVFVLVMMYLDHRRQSKHKHIHHSS